MHNLKTNKGLIALDIDGTLTTGFGHIPDEVFEHLKKLNSEGWEIAFITGRSLSSIQQFLLKVSFPMHVGVQNGAELIHYPTLDPLYGHFLPKSSCNILEKVYHECDEDAHYVAYSGSELGDKLFYNPSRFSDNKLNLIRMIVENHDKVWQAIESYESIPLAQIPMFYLFGSRSFLRNASEHLSDMSYSVIFESSKKEEAIGMLSHKEANKGGALKALKNHLNIQGPVIVAGDDANDIPMFQEADKSIAMGNAIDSLKKMADVIAPPSHQMGIIDGLKKLTSTLSN